MLELMASAIKQFSERSIFLNIINFLLDLNRWYLTDGT